VHGTKGVYYSNKDVTVNVLKEDKQITLFITGTATWNAICSVEEVGTENVPITPDKSSKIVFQYGKQEEPFIITIVSGDEILAEFTYPLNIPIHDPGEPPEEKYSESTAAGCWLKGLHRDKEGGTHEALRLFRKAIEMDPNFTPAMTSLGELKLHSGEYTEAKDLLEKSIYLNINDGWAKFYLAQVYLELGRIEEALVMAFKSAQLTETISPGYNLAGAILIRQGEFAKAVYPLTRAVEMNGQELSSRNLLAFAYWKTGNPETAKELIASVQKRDPLDIYSAIIQGMMGEKNGLYKRIAGRKEEVLDAADFFLTAGLKDEAVNVLEKYYLDADIQEPCPVIHYYYGILKNDLQRLNGNWQQAISTRVMEGIENLVKMQKINLRIIND